MRDRYMCECGTGLCVSVGQVYVKVWDRSVRECGTGLCVSVGQVYV
jgi:hypothetical protein